MYGDVTGAPEYGAMVAGELRVYPSPDTTYNVYLVYELRLVPLSASATQNWLITNHPDIYLYSVLLEAEPYLKNDDRVRTWAELRERGLEELDLDTKREEWPDRMVSRPSRPIG
jgi:hypothetical protein